MRKIFIYTLLLAAALVLFAGCSNEKTTSPENKSDSSNTPAASSNSSDDSNDVAKKDEAAQAITDPHNVAVMVNKQFSLPENYEPTDLVYPNVRFTFKEKIEKRKMRKEAAEALEKMFAGAEKDGVYLAGVSAYRSHKTQTAVFNRYVKKRW